jgi:hypothetical protein
LLPPSCPLGGSSGPNCLDDRRGAQSEPPPLAYAAAKAAAAKALSLEADFGDAHAAYATAVLMPD